MNALEQHKDKIFELCQKHQVRQLYAFGSVITDNFNPTSELIY
jgi:predicted nucleotidyltransferase